jgi:glutathione S-transferase
VTLPSSSWAISATKDLCACHFPFYQAKYEGVDLKISKVHPYEKDAGFEPYVEKFPHAQGKIPALEGAGVSITECVAICHVSYP